MRGPLRATGSAADGSTVHCWPGPGVEHCLVAGVFGRYGVCTAARGTQCLGMGCRGCSRCGGVHRAWVVGGADGFGTEISCGSSRELDGRGSRSRGGGLGLESAIPSIRPVPAPRPRPHAAYSVFLCCMLLSGRFSPHAHPHTDTDGHKKHTGRAGKARRRRGASAVDGRGARTRTPLAVKRGGRLMAWRWPPPAPPPPSACSGSHEAQAQTVVNQLINSPASLLARRASSRTIRELKSAQEEVQPLRW
jgi:hypothetical protein